jgi:hypothetical protein
VREFSSLLNRSARSPFRGGETPVLPLDLVRKWPEYRVMEAGDVVLTVEHCCNCHEHELYTHHKEQQYVQVTSVVVGSPSNWATLICVLMCVHFYSWRSKCGKRCPPRPCSSPCGITRF